MKSSRAILMFLPQEASGPRVVLGKNGFLRKELHSWRKEENGVIGLASCEQGRLLRGRPWDPGKFTPMDVGGA